MANETPRRYDDYDDDIDLASIKKKTGSNTLILLLIGGVLVVLLTCLLGAGIVAWSLLSSDSQPDQFIGSWKGRWTLHGVTFDSIYTFKKDGTFREESFDLQGQAMNVSDGRWRFHNGLIEINWNNGSFEHAQATLVDARTINYRIVNHIEVAQIGLTTTFRQR